MLPQWTLLWQPDDALQAGSLGLLPQHVARRGAVVLATSEPLQQTIDGKAIGVFDGVIFNHSEAAEPLIGRGAPIADDAGLALHALGWFGLPGLASLRWHGALAVLHQAQGTAIVARDWQGVGGLYWAPWQRGQAFANTPERLHALGGTPRLVPPGMLAICAPSGVTWQAAPSNPETRAWFRELPDELAAPTPAIWQQGLQQRLEAAVAACRRTYPGLAQEPPEDRAGAWLRDQVQLPASAHPDAIWALAGADAWLGLAAEAPLELLPGPWPMPEPAEPLRVDDRHARERRVRATWLADIALEAARVRANAADLPIVAPHLDPAVLAWLGVMPDALRPLA